MVATQALVAGFLIYSFTLLINPWMLEFTLDRATVLSAMTLHLVANGASAIFIGQIMDRMPSRLFVPAGLALFAISLVLISIASGFLWIGLIYALVLPVAYHLAGPLAAMSLIARNFEHRRGLALGLGAIGASLGGVILPLSLTFLLTDFGWRLSLQALGALTALVLIPLSYLVLRSESLPKSSSESPDLGSPRIGLSALLRNDGFRIYAGSIFLAFISFFAIQSNVAPYLADLGAGSAGVATVLASMSLASVAGKLVAGVLADRLDNRLLFGAASGLSAIGAFLLMGTPAFEQALCAFIALGFGFGAYLPLNSSLAIRIFGAQNVATILGALSLVVTLCAMFPALAGLIRDRVGSYDLALAVGGASALCSIALISMLKVTVPTWTGDTSAGEK